MGLNLDVKCRISCNVGKTMPQTIPQITINRWYGYHSQMGGLCIFLPPFDEFAEHVFCFFLSFFPICESFRCGSLGEYLLEFVFLLHSQA